MYNVAAVVQEYPADEVILVDGMALGGGIALGATIIESNRQLRQAEQLAGQQGSDVVE